MTLIEKLRQIERVDHLIRRKSTGSPATLARRLGASERYVYKLIKLMRTLGAPISFCHQRQSYCYEEDVEFKFGFISSGGIPLETRGGKTFFLPLYNLCSLAS